MSKSTAIDLIKITTAQDADGIDQQIETSRHVFARVDTVNAAEFFEGGRNGLNPSLRFLVFTGDYRGEQIVQHDGLRFGVYRTYVRGDRTEIYVERKGGTNGTRD